MTKPLQKQRCLMSSMKVRRAVVLMLSSMSTKRSIKDAERVKRGADTGIQFKNIAPGHKIQQWRKLLSSPANKTSLTKFLMKNGRGPNKDRNSRIRYSMLPVSSSVSRSPRSSGMRPKNWNHHKKKRTHASYYMLFM